MKTKSTLREVFAGLILFILISVNSIAQDQPWWNSWVKYPTNEPVIVGENGSWYHWVSCPNVIFEDGIFKMWFRGLSKENDVSGYPQQQIGYAWSYDGINWSVKEEPVIPRETNENWCFIKGPGTVQRINDTLRMWYWGVDTNMVAAISYAWSIDDTTWHENSEPVLEGGEVGTWDENDPWLGYVFYDTSMYHLYYIASENAGHYEEIGHATSPDGIHWERDPTNPVLNLGPDGSFNDYRMMSGPVIFHEDTLHMFFSGYDAHDGSQHPMIGHAWSTDSPNWSEWNVGNNGKPVLEVGESGSWDQRYADLPGVLYHDGIFHMWYDGRAVPVSGKIGYARQSVSCLSEGITFTTQAQIDSYSSDQPYCNNIVGDVIISGEDISNLDSLVFLTSIDGNLLLQDNGTLENISGLVNITSIGGSLTIDNNASLQSLNGLDNLKSIGGNLSITGNILLENCHIEAICNYLGSSSGSINITDNATGCINQEEVEIACGIIDVSELITMDKISLHPNPASDEVFIQCSDCKNIECVTIYSIEGKKVLSEKYITNRIDVSMIAKGLYIIELETSKFAIKQKLIIE